MATDLEKAVMATGRAVRGVQFGQSLRECHPGRRGDAEHLGGLRSFEVNHSPAISRTFHVLELHDRVGADLDTDGEEQYLEFVARALIAMRRVAAKLWAPILQEIRTVIFDEDDLGADMSHYIPRCRTDELGPALKFQGLDSESVQLALREMIGSARATPAYAAACAGAEVLTEVRDAALEERDRIVARLNRGANAPESHADVAARWRKTCNAAYDEVAQPLRGAAHAIRSYNRLVQYALWAILGIAEALEDLPVFRSGLGTVRVREGAQMTHVTMTLREAPFFGHPPAPFELRADFPIDGLYLSDRSLVQFGGELFTDVSGLRVGSLERAPVQQ